MTVCCPTCGSEVERIDPAKAVASIPLGKRDRTILEYLAARFGQYVPPDVLAAAMVANDPDGGPLSAQSIVGIAIWRIKPRLGAVGLAIESQGGPGGGRRLTWAREGGAG